MVSFSKLHTYTYKQLQEYAEEQAREFVENQAKLGHKADLMAAECGVYKALVSELHIQLQMQIKLNESKS